MNNLLDLLTHQIYSLNRLFRKVYWSRLINKKIALKVKWDIALFDSLKEITPLTKKRIKFEVKTHLRIFALKCIIHQYLVLFPISLIIGVVSFILMVFWLIRIFDLDNFSSPFEFIPYAISVGLLGLTVISLQLGFWVTENRYVKNAVIIGAFTVMALVYGFALLLLKNLKITDGKLFNRFSLIVLVWGFGIYFAFSLYAVISEILSTRLYWRRRKIVPDSIVIYNLIGMLSILDENPNHWANVECRKELIRILNEISICIEYYLPKRLAIADPVNDDWGKAKSKQIAANIQSLQRWVYLPKADTYPYLIKYLSRMLEQIVKGDWDGLDRMQPESLPGKRQWLEKLKTLGRITTIAITPVLGLILLQRSPLALQTLSLDYAKLAVVIWVIVSVLANLDPLYENKVKSMKEFSNIFPFIKSKSKDE